MSCTRKDQQMCLHPLLIDLSTAGTSYVSAVGGSGFTLEFPEFFTYRSYAPHWTSRLFTKPNGNSFLVNGYGTPLNVSY